MLKFILIIFLYIFIAVHVDAKRETCKGKVDLALRREITRFIDSTSDSKYFSKYNIYVLYLYHERSSVGCTIGYFMSARDYDYIKPTYYFKYQDQFFVIRTDDTALLKEFSSFKVGSISQNVKDSIIHKSDNNPYSFIEGRFRGEVLHIQKCNVESRYYQNADSIQIGLCIYPNMSDFQIEYKGKIK